MHRLGLCVVFTAAVVGGCAASVVSPRDGSADSRVGETAVDVIVVDVPVVDVGPDLVVIDVPAPDVLQMNLPYGSPCVADAECTSRICARSTNLFGRCTIACAQDDACTAMGAGVHCALDRAPTGPRWVCSTVDGSSALAGQDCTVDRECFSNACDGIACHGPCMADSECTPGFRCGDYAIAGGSVRGCRFTPITGTVVEDFRLFEGITVADVGLPDRLLIVPPDVASLTYIVHDLDGSEIFASVPRLEAPDGTLLIDSRTWNGITEQPTREILSEYQINAAFAPTNERLRLTGGFYRASYALFNDRSRMTMARNRRMRVTVRIKRSPGGVVARGTLHMRIFFVGLPGGPTAATAAGNARLQNAVNQMRAIYASFNVNVIVDGYTDITGPDAATFSTIDSRDEMAQLFTRTTASSGDVLNVFMIRGISMSAGLGGAIGVAGDIGGPPGVHGTTHSGVLMGWETTFGGGRDLLPQTMAHECGHFLGLWHLVERVPGCTAPGQMNCAPFGGVDAIADTPTSMAASTPYLMNWFTDGTNNRVTAGQGTVVRLNPLVTP